MTMTSGTEMDPRERVRLVEANAKLLEQRLGIQRSGAQPIAESTGSQIGPSRLSDPLGLWDKARVPKRHSVRIDFDKSPIGWKAKAKWLVEKAGSGYLAALIGNRGTGKTQLAAYAVANQCLKGRTALYVKAMEIFLEVRATYSDPLKSELQAIERFIEPKILVIDEIQQRGETSFEDRILTHIIDRRYDDMSDTILIGNLTPENLKESLDPSITDRLRETGGIAECCWESFRGRTQLLASGEPI